ncbi:helix-turn-helix transcriptional regulator [Actinoallomurus liliacearum]|uniref:Helix-turn-helix transcriptional regulator n=1 Tax=Actinoallomurus liliacearum TaxID=1080073 RepID=A0ABP8TT36_9ACTN
MSSPSSSVQAARQAIADRLREIRVDAGLTAKALAFAAEWDRTKISKIEHASRPPSVDDIRRWCAVCKADDQAADLVASLRTVEGAYVEWRRLQRTGLRRLQESRVPLYERTRNFRVYCSQVVPGLFQTAAYAGALLSAITTFHDSPNDVEEAVAARMARSHVVRDGDHRFAVLVEESVLRYQVGGPETMAGQLHHLLDIMAMPSVSLGVIPFDHGGRRMWTLEGFNIFDSAQVSVELLSAAVTVTTPGEVELYAKAFAELSTMAVFGTAARALITAAIDTLG